SEDRAYRPARIRTARAITGRPATHTASRARARRAPAPSRQCAGAALVHGRIRDMERWAARPGGGLAAARRVPDRARTAARLARPPLASRRDRCPDRVPALRKRGALPLFPRGRARLRPDARAVGSRRLAR